MSDDNTYQGYLEQYKKCYTMWVHLNTLAWQVPATTLTVDSALIGVALQYLTNSIARGTILLLGGVFTWLMLVQIAAHRRGTEIVTQYSKYVATQFLKLQQDVPLEKNEVMSFMESHQGWTIKDPLYHGFLVKQRSYFWFQYTFIILSITLLFSGTLSILGFL